jgi:iron complex outermembrane recepter protein
VPHFTLRRLAGAFVAIGFAPVLRTSWAQSPIPARSSVTGIVIDSASASPIIAAEVRLLELHRLERTHEDGRFDFRDVPPGRYTLNARRIGYRVVTRAVVVPNEAADVRVALVPAAVQLATTVVTGALTERPGDEVLSPTVVLSGAALDRRLDATLAASLGRTPGVSISSISPSTARPVIRGLGGDRIVVLEDGQRPGDLSAMSGDHAVTIDPLTAQQIDVVRGPMSLLYGSSALGGVVNVIREEVPISRPDRLHGVVTAQGSSVNRGGTIGGTTTAALGPLTTRVEGSLRGAGDTRTPVGTMVNTGVEEYNLSAGASLIGNWGHAGGSYRFYANDYGIPGGFVGGHATGVDIVMRRHTGRAEADWHVDRGALTNIRATATATDYHHTENEPSGRVGTLFDQTVYAGELTARHAAVGPLALGAIGVRAQSRDVLTGGSLQTPSTSDLSLAGFLVEEIGGGATRFQMGVRYDYGRYEPKEQTFIDVGGVRVPVRERTFGAVSGSLGVLRTLGEGIRFGASFNRAYRTPDFNELYSNGPHLAANSYIVGDPNLNEETGIGVDAFLRVSRGTFNAEVAGFRNRLVDFIFESSRGRAEIGPQGGRPRFQFTNEGAVFTGGEGRIEWSATSALVVDATASYVQAHFTTERDSIPEITPTDTVFHAPSPYPPFIPPLNGQIGARVDRTRWFAGLTARYAAPQHRLGDFETPTAGYFVPGVDLGLRTVRGGQLHTVTLRVDNALDLEYRDHLSRIKEIMPEPGRNVSLLYRMTF